MGLKLKATPLSESEDELSDLDDEVVAKRIKLIRDSSDIKKSKPQFSGGIVVSSEADSSEQQTSSSLSAAEKKGLKEVEELERELDLKNTFSKETNRRDEDAEMNKYIEEQIRLRRAAARKQEDDKEAHKGNHSGLMKASELDDLFSLPATAEGASEKVDDVLLHSLAKHYSSKLDEKSEAMLSSQMLNGIPEVDLGLKERIRTIEQTEEAKLRMITGPSRGPRRPATNHFHGPWPPSSSSGRGDNRNNGAESCDAKVVIESVVSVGEEPRQIGCRVPTSTTSSRPPAKGRASDDYHLQKFKKNMRR